MSPVRHESRVVATDRTRSGGYNNKFDVMIPERHYATCINCGTKLRKEVQQDAEPGPWVAQERLPLASGADGRHLFDQDSPESLWAKKEAARLIAGIDGLSHVGPTGTLCWALCLADDSPILQRWPSMRG